jgi:hypothetical protein
MVTGAVAAAGLLTGTGTGCSARESAERRTPGSGSAPDAARKEAAERAGLAATSGALRDQYDAVLAHHPSLAGRLAPLRAAVAEHVTALAGTVAPGTVAPPTPSATPSASLSPSVPADAAAALKALAAAERRTADAHTASLSDAEPELARLLASVAAAGAAHAYLLTKRDAP